MKKYEYKTEFVPLPVEKIQDALCEFGSVGWRTVQASPVEGGSMVILEREIEADKQDIEEAKYDVIYRADECHKDGIDCCFRREFACPGWARDECEENDVIFVKKGGNQ